MKHFKGSILFQHKVTVIQHWFVDLLVLKIWKPSLTQQLNVLKNVLIRMFKCLSTANFYSNVIAHQGLGACVQWNHQLRSLNRIFQSEEGDLILVGPNVNMNESNQRLTDE